MTRPWLLALVSCLLLAAGDDPGDRGKLQGVWACVSSEDDGGPRTAQELDGVRMRFLGDRFAETKGAEAPEFGTFRLDPARDPKAIDFRFPGAPDLLGIYKLDGDTLTLCMGERRPKSFSVDPSDPVSTVAVYKRETPASGR